MFFSDMYLRAQCIIVWGMGGGGGLGGMGGRLCQYVGVGEGGAGGVATVFSATPPQIPPDQITDTPPQINKKVITL